MVLRSRREYLEAIRLRYHRSCKKDKAVILDEFCTICGYNRNYAIRLLRKKAAGLDSRKRPDHAPSMMMKAFSIWLLFLEGVAAGKGRGKVCCF